MRTVKRKYHYFYKITNNINNHYYYGIHSTDDLDDGYMGSGTRLRYAYEKYGIENFTKEILKFFETREDLARYESEVVTEVLVKDTNCYNIALGGDSGATTIGMATVKDQNGNIMQVPVDDPRYLSGELVGHSKGYTNCFDTEQNKYVKISNDEFANNSRYVGLTCGKIPVIVNDTGETIMVLKEEYYNNKDKYTTTYNTTNKIFCKDKQGNSYYILKTDPRYLSGELKYFWCGKKHKQETIEKVKRTFQEIGHQQGEKNSQYGTCWIMKDGENKKIKKEELEDYISQGWKKGRTCKKYK